MVDFVRVPEVEAKKSVIASALGNLRQSLFGSQEATAQVCCPYVQHVF